MLSKDEIQGLMQNADDKNFYDFKERIKADVDSDLDTTAKSYINSGDAFNDFVASSRFTEAKEDINDVAAKYYKKYKNNTKKISAALEEDGYKLPEISKIIKIIKSM